MRPGILELQSAEKSEGSYKKGNEYEKFTCTIHTCGGFLRARRTGTGGG